MQILGIRTSSKAIRYAILEWDKQKVTFLNSGTENKLDYPASIQTVEQKLNWLYQEIERVLRQYNSIEHIVVKTNEYVREKAATRQSTYMDGVIMLIAAQRGKKLSTKLYANIQKGLGSKKIQAFAEQVASRSAKYWNTQMADAVVAAWSGGND
ncbi:hypothetical protein ACFL3G_06175 [Planctomycetota bacterium]